MAKLKLYKVTCPYCGRNAELTRFNFRGRWVFRYECKPCDAHVGCHSGTTKPLGTPAKLERRRMRMAAHAAMDYEWQHNGRKRLDVYDELARL